MAAGDSELAARAEAKAERLVTLRSGNATAAEERRVRDEQERARAASWRFTPGEAGCGLVLIPFGASVVGGILDFGGCVLNSCSGGGLFSYSYWLWAAAFPFGVVAAIVFFAKTISANGRVRRFKEAVSNDDEAVQLAQQRLAAARALQDRVRALAGRMRSAADDADLETAASQLARLERELDSELA